MKEQDVHPRESWDIDAVAHGLGTDPVPRLHKVHGPGYRMALGVPEAPTAELDVYPETGMLRYQGEGISLAITGAVPYIANEDGFVFNASTPTEVRTLIVGPLGEVTLFVEPRAEPPEDLTDEPPKATLSGRLVEDPIPGRTRHGAPMTRMALRRDGEEASTDVFAFGTLAHDAELYFHRGGEYRFTGEHKLVANGGSAQREIFVLNGMTIGRERSSQK